MRSRAQRVFIAPRAPGPDGAGSAVRGTGGPMLTLGRSRLAAAAFLGLCLLQASLGEEVLLDHETTGRLQQFWTTHRGGLLTTQPTPRHLAADLTQGLTPIPPVHDTGLHSDGQWLVADAEVMPFAAIGQIRLAGNDSGVSYCTGALISQDPPVVLTAAHCWLDVNTQQPGFAGAWVPGYNVYGTPSQAPFGYANVTGAKVPQPFVDAVLTSTCEHNCSDYDYGGSAGYTPAEANSDYALLFLDGPATPFTLAVGYNDSLPLVQTVYTAGYPGDKCQNDPSPEGFFHCTLWYTECPQSTVLSENLTNVDVCLAGGGQSGSPMWVEPEPDRLMIIGVLTSGPFGDYDYSEDGEGATQYTQITQQVFNNIEAWIKDGVDNESEGAVTYTANPTYDAYEYTYDYDYSYYSSDYDYGGDYGGDYSGQQSQEGHKGHKGRPHRRKHRHSKG